MNIKLKLVGDYELEIYGSLDKALLYILGQILKYEEAELLEDELEDKNKASKIHIHFKGENNMASPDVKVGQTIIATATETDVAGLDVKVDATKLTWTVDKPGIVTLTTNTDGTASFHADAVGTVNVTVTDSSNNLSTTELLSVVSGGGTGGGGTATAVHINWGIPV